MRAAIDVFHMWGWSGRQQRVVPEIYLWWGAEDFLVKGSHPSNLKKIGVFAMNVNSLIPTGPIQMLFFVSAHKWRACILAPAWVFFFYVSLHAFNLEQRKIMSLYTRH